MKTQHDIKVPAKIIKEHIRVVEKTICDVPNCGKEAAFTKCRICSRDICREHITYDFPDGGDYADHYCPICHALFIPARDLMNARHWEEERLEASIKEESLRSTNNIQH